MAIAGTGPRERDRDPADHFSRRGNSIRRRFLCVHDQHGRRAPESTLNGKGETRVAEQRRLDWRGVRSRPATPAPVTAGTRADSVNRVGRSEGILARGQPGIGQRLEKCDEIAALLGVEVDPADFVGRRIKVTAPVVEIHDVGRGREGARVHIRPAQRDIAQAGREKLAAVQGDSRDDAAFAVFRRGRRPHAEVVGESVGEDHASVAGDARFGGKGIQSARDGGRPGHEERVGLVERCAVGKKGSFIARDGECDSHRRDFGRAESVLESSE